MRWLWRSGDQAGSGRLRLSRDARLIVTGQGVRAAGYGFTAVLLGALLAARGFSSLRAGVVLTALIAGTALASLAVGRFGDRFGRRHSYAVFFAGIAAAGAAVATGGPWWVLLVVALTGTLSTDVVDNGPATTLEQAMLAAEDAGTAAVYGRYNAVGSAAGALGSLAVILPGLGPHGSGGVNGGLFLVLVPVGISGMVLAARLSPAVESSPGLILAAGAGDPDPVPARSFPGGGPAAGRVVRRRCCGRRPGHRPGFCPTTSPSGITRRWRRWAGCFSPCPWCRRSRWRSPRCWPAGSV